MTFKRFRDAWINVGEELNIEVGSGAAPSLCDALSHKVHI